MAQKIYQQVARNLEKLISNGELKPMSRLPPERELAARFEVSRTTVREALMVLEAAKIIEIKDRSGAYVMPQVTEGRGFLSSIEKEPGPHEVLQLRRLIEGEACFQVALSGSDKAIAAIVAANKAASKVPPNDTPDYHAATKQFHMAIAEGSENSLFVELLDSLWEQKSGPLWSSWYGGTRSRSNRVIATANDQEVTDAIVARRPQAARTAMQRHIDWMIARFLSYG